MCNHIHLSVDALISPSQHGFVNNRSTITNLATFTQFVSNIIDKLGQVDVIYTDFSKAFDRIDHNILSNKLDNFGFSTSLIAFFKSYLSNRKQFVSYNGYDSTIINATSGVPQGSNLGPLLFILFINDLAGIIKSENLLFADDLKIYLNISSLQDCVKLQNDVNTIQNWCTSNKLNLNISKCKVVTFTKKHSGIQFLYDIDGNILERTNSIKDLGIKFNSKLNFSEHMNDISVKAMRMLGFIVRNCRTFTNIQAFKILYFSYIRSKLEYGSLIWYPFYLYQKSALENIQRKFLKLLVFIEDGFYPERGYDHTLLLSRYDVQSLESRRKCSSIAFLYKLLHNSIDCTTLLSQLYFLVPRPNSRHSLTFYYPYTRTNVLLNSPINIICDNYNRISHVCDINYNSYREVLRVARDSFD